MDRSLIDMHDGSRPSLPLQAPLQARERPPAADLDLGLSLAELALAALARGDLQAVAAAIHQQDAEMQALAETLRICQAGQLDAQRAAGRAEAANRAKSAFLSRVSHELRTPLNAVLGFAQLMRLEAEGGDLVLKPHRVALIETASRHLLDLINEVLDVSRIESGQMAVQLTSFDPHELLLECLPLVHGLAEKDRIELIDRAAGRERQPVIGDRLRMKQVLINLLSNAVKYNRPGGRVEVDILDADQQVAVTVEDTGRGLDAEQLQNLFQPFNRLGAETSTIEGTGMGLYVSRRFVELMGGRIDIRSQPGTGTCVSVSLNRP